MQPFGSGYVGGAIGLLHMRTILTISTAAENDTKPMNHRISFDIFWFLYVFGSAMGYIAP
jgi:hypothetical protein